MYKIVRSLIKSRTDGMSAGRYDTRQLRSENIQQPEKYKLNFGVSSEGPSRG